LTMADPAISKETLNAVFESMYGKTLEITSSNVSALYTVGLKFGVKELMEKCEKTYLCNVPLDTFFVEYQKAQSEKSPLHPILKKYLIENLKSLPLDQLLAVTNKMTEEDLIAIVSSDTVKCEEDLMYEIADSWCKSNDSGNKKSCDVSY